MRILRILRIGRIELLGVRTAQNLSPVRTPKEVLQENPLIRQIVRDPPKTTTIGPERVSARTDELARLALVIVLGALLLEQRDRLQERRNALHRTVGHVHRRLTTAAHDHHVTTLAHEILDQLAD